MLKKNDIFDVVGILTNPKLLYLLNLATSYRKVNSEVINFFDSIYVNLIDEFVEEYKDMSENKSELPNLEINKTISIRSLWNLLGAELLTIEELKDFLDDNCDIDFIYNLYKLYYYVAPIVEDDTIYEIPEGIRKLGLSRKRLSYWIYRNIEKRLETGPYEVKLPSTMEEFDITILYNVFNLKMLVLNEGLRKLYRNDRPYADGTLEIEELFIPSTLETIDWDFFGREQLKYIIFTNFKESKILKNRELIRLLLEKYCKYVITLGDNNNPILTINFNTCIILEDENRFEFEIKQLSKIVSWSNVISFRCYYYPSNKEKRIIEDWFYKKIEKLIESNEINDDEENVFKLKK